MPADDELRAMRRQALKEGDAGLAAAVARRLLGDPPPPDGRRDGNDDRPRRVKPAGPVTPASARARLERGLEDSARRRKGAKR